jgi:hypothetical protein
MSNRISSEDFPPLDLLVKHLRTLREDFSAVFDNEVGEFAASYSDFWTATRDKNSLEAAWFAYAQCFLPETPPAGGGREVLEREGEGLKERELDERELQERELRERELLEGEWPRILSLLKKSPHKLVTGECHPDPIRRIAPRDRGEDRDR